MSERSDTGKRGHLALALSISEEDDAYVLFFDDLHLVNPEQPRKWEHKTFVTTAVIPKDKFETLDFSTEEMAGLGPTILGSLKAAYSGKKRRQRR